MPMVEPLRGGGSLNLSTTNKKNPAKVYGEEGESLQFRVQTLDVRLCSTYFCCNCLHWRIQGGGALRGAAPPGCSKFCEKGRERGEKLPKFGICPPLSLIPEYASVCVSSLRWIYEKYYISWEENTVERVKPTNRYGLYSKYPLFSTLLLYFM